MDESSVRPAESSGGVGRLEMIKSGETNVMDLSLYQKEIGSR